MKKIKISAVILLIFISAMVTAQTQAPEGDKVIAVVGNDIITESEFQYQIESYASQNQIQEISPYLVQQIFQQMLTNKIILAKAEQDSISVTDEEVNKELEGRIKNLIDQVGSQERLEEIYSMSLPKIKARLKEDLQKNLKVEKLKRRKFQNGIKVSEREIRDFFNTYRDSLPDVSEEFELSQILMERKVSDAEKIEAKRIAQLILDSIKAGGDFSDLAKRNSTDSMSAIQGGDLGYARKGTFVKEFEETVFNLNPGEVSEVVETQFGYHIIKLNEKLGDKVKSQHILIKFPKFESSDFETINFLKDLKARIENGEITFEEASKQYSEDEASKLKGGNIGKIGMEQLDSMTVVSLKGLSAGQITEPLRLGSDISYGYVIYKLGKVYPEHKLTIEDDYERVKKFAVSFKENTEMEKWINEMRETIYVDVKM
ncbi:MAG: peptidylprolyl isomerase [bacterium]|nr:peptidylprolyl isomerase [bacterium]